jgi:YD repeat-containing protein
MNPHSEHSTFNQFGYAALFDSTEAGSNNAYGQGRSISPNAYVTVGPNNIQVTRGDFTSYVFEQQSSGGGITNYTADSATYTPSTISFDGTTAPVTQLKTTFTYDPINRLVGRKDPGLLNLAFRYDAADRRVGLTDPDNGLRTYTFDADDRLSLFQGSDSLVTTFTCDALGRKTLMQFGSGERTGYGYDAASQILTLVTDNGAGSVAARLTYVYDPVGNRAVMQDGNGSWGTFSYDAKNRLTQDLTSGTNAHNYTYSFDGNDNRLTSSETGVVTNWSYDVANRLLTGVASGQTTSYAHTPEGSRSQVAEPGGTVYNYGQDGEFRLAYQSASTGGIRTWLYDADGKMAKYVGPNPAGFVTIVWDGDDYLKFKS